jgi:hypothetical protein
VPDPIARATRYRARAAECRQLADIASDKMLGAEYARIAEHYLALAEAEEKIAASGKE